MGSCWPRSGVLCLGLLGKLRVGKGEAGAAGPWQPQDLLVGLLHAEEALTGDPSGPQALIVRFAFHGRTLLLIFMLLLNLLWNFGFEMYSCRIMSAF